VSGVKRTALPPCALNLQVCRPSACSSANTSVVTEIVADRRCPRSPTRKRVDRGSCSLPPSTRTALSGHRVGDCAPSPSRGLIGSLRPSQAPVRSIARHDSTGAATSVGAACVFVVGRTIPVARLLCLPQVPRSPTRNREKGTSHKQSALHQTQNTLVGPFLTIFHPQAKSQVASRKSQVASRKSQVPV